MTEFSIGARIRAARQLAGYENIPDFAQALKKRGNEGLGATTLYRTERDERPFQTGELAEIAALCGVPLAWFTADFDQLDKISEEPAAVLARLKAALETARTASALPQPPNRVVETKGKDASPTASTQDEPSTGKEAGGQGAA